MISSRRGCGRVSRRASVRLAVGRRERTLRAAAVEPPARGYGTLLLRLPRAVRGDLRRGRRVRLMVTAIAADVAANTATRARSVLLLP